MKCRLVSIPLISLFLISGVASTSAQTYTCNQINAKADIVLQTIFPKHLIPATRRRESPYYLSQTADGEQWNILTANGKTEGKLKQVNLIYDFFLKHTSCFGYSDLRTVITMQLDSNLQLVECKGINTIPDFIKDNLPCPLLNYYNIREVLRKNNIPDYAVIRPVIYDSNAQKFYCLITGKTITPADSLVVGQKAEIETLKINAETGEVIENTFSSPTDN